MKTKLKILFVVLCSVFALAACSALLTTLEGLNDANDIFMVAVPILVNSGTISPAFGNVAAVFSEDVATSTGSAITEAESTDSPLLMSEVIAKDYAPVLQDIPGLPPFVATLAKDVITGVTTILGDLKTANTELRAGGKLSASKKMIWKMAHHRLEKQKLRAAAAKSKAAAFLATHAAK